MQEKIIHFLKRADGYLSGEEISKELNISRAAIWKNIQELRNQGYDIVAVPHLGYKLVSLPDKLFAEEIQFDLNNRIVGKKIVYLEEVPSAMDVAFDLGIKGAVEGTVVCAESQRSGRGRMGRTWASPKGQGIYMSILLKPSLAPNEVARLTLLCAVAVCEAIKKVTGLAVSIKWPNDILIEKKKVGGILTELSAETDRVKFVIIGIGINVNTRPSHLPARATSLKMEIKRRISRVELAREILRQMESRYVSFQRGGFIPIIKKWKEYSATLNQRVKVSGPSGTIEGEAVDIDLDGGLLIRKNSGVVFKKMAGDVSLTH